jgi:hypothetical protein
LRAVTRLFYEAVWFLTFYRFIKGLGAKSGWLLSASNNFNIAPMGD